MSRVTRKMMNSNSIYNINANKALLDEKNTQMATQKKFVDPSDDPITAIRSLRFKGNLSEVSQYLDRNVSDAISWNESTMTAIDTARDLMRSLKAEYTSAANGTNEIKDREIYLQNAENLVKEYFSIGNSTMEARHIFTGYRTDDSLTFSQADFDKRKSLMDDPSKPLFNYVQIAEKFNIGDIENYTYTSRDFSKGAGSGVNDDEITDLKTTDADDLINETELKNNSVYRLRLSYSDLDSGISHNVTDLDFVPINDDFTIPDPIEDGKIYFNKKKGTLIFGESTKTTLVEKMGSKGVTFSYNKSNWKVGDVKPEYYFDCSDIALSPAIDYNDHEQGVEFNMGDSQSIKINANASDVFSLQAVRDIDELRDALNQYKDSQNKVTRLKEMKANAGNYSDAELAKISQLLYAAEKEMNYNKDKVDDMFKTCMTRADKYYDQVNKAGTDAGAISKRLELISRRLSADKITIQTQTSDNENVDLSVLAVDVSEASLLYSSALQVTGKISQQTLVNYI